MSNADRAINPNRSMTRRTRRLKSDSTAVLAGIVAAVGSPPIRFYGLSPSDFGQIFIAQQTPVDVDSVEGVKLF
jgi:hypothetical protein